ncbi:hypothetical protein IW262DRAFT_1302194 [Armillaria fumosa]|nr:hypothetical protein IW262DRAFT_1302194 [Armillaria fumosa]
MNIIASDVLTIFIDNLTPRKTTNVRHLGVSLSVKATTIPGGFFSYSSFLLPPNFLSSHCALSRTFSIFHQATDLGFTPVCVGSPLRLEVQVVSALAILYNVMNGVVSVVDSHRLPLTSGRSLITDITLAFVVVFVIIVLLVQTQTSAFSPDMLYACTLVPIPRAAAGNPGGDLGTESIRQYRVSMNTFFWLYFANGVAMSGLVGPGVGVMRRAKRLSSLQLHGIIGVLVLVPPSLRLLLIENMNNSRAEGPCQVLYILLVKTRADKDARQAALQQLKKQNMRIMVGGIIF